MSQSIPSKSSDKNTKVYSLQLIDDDNFVLIPHDDAEANDSDSATEETKTETSEQNVKEVVEHICGMCGRSYSSFYTLKNHMKNCTKKSPHIDETYEEYTLAEIQGMQKSIRELFSRNICYCCEENLETAHSGHIRCQDCFKSFKNVTSYRRHVSFVHSSLSSAIPCIICNAKCPTNTILDVHMEAHVKGKKPFACQKCGKEFTRKYHLIRHEQYSNCDPTKQKEPHKCNVCNKEFFRLDNLRQHLRTHIGEEPKPREYNCPYCEKSFVGTTILNVHIRTHTGEKPFACDLCSKGFPSNGALRKHRRSHTGEKPFKCEVCSRAFAAKEVLNRHMKTHTGVRPYVCKECGKGFIQATQLKIHMFHHTGESGFQCGKCEVKFSRKKGLTTHNEDFHCDDKKILDCLVCQITFTAKEDIIAHFKDIHKKKLYMCRACGCKFLHLSKHPECTRCRYCKSKEYKKPHLHEHLSIETTVLTVRKAISMSDGDSQSSEAEDTGNRRKLKILTSKQKMNKISDRSKAEVIDQKISPQTRRTTRSRRVQRKDDAQQEENVVDAPPKSEVTVQDPYEPITIDNMIKVEEPDETVPGRMDDETLKECVGQLLNVLLDPDLLAGFGWPIASIEHVLSSVIRQCGHQPADYDRCSDYSTIIRENVKLLFTVVVENDAFRELLNNHTIDEVVLHILKMTGS